MCPAVTSPPQPVPLPLGASQKHHYLALRERQNLPVQIQERCSRKELLEEFYSLLVSKSVLWLISLSYFGFSHFHIFIPCFGELMSSLPLWCLLLSQPLSFLWGLFPVLSLQPCSSPSLLSLFIFSQVMQARCKALRTLRSPWNVSISFGTRRESGLLGQIKCVNKQD